MAVFIPCPECGHEFADHSLAMHGCSLCACDGYVVHVGQHYPQMPPSFPDETPGEYTDRLTGADRTDRRPYDHPRNRQCSIGYHDECSDGKWSDYTGECRCPHHTDPNYRTEVEQEQDSVCDEIERIVKDAIYDARNAGTTIDAGARDAAEKITAMLIEGEYL